MGSYVGVVDRELLPAFDQRCDRSRPELGNANRRLDLGAVKRLRLWPSAGHQTHLTDAGSVTGLPHSRLVTHP